MESCVSNQFAALFRRAQRVGATSPGILIARFRENNPANFAFSRNPESIPGAQAYSVYIPTIPSVDKITCSSAAIRRGTGNSFGRSKVSRLVRQRVYGGVGRLMHQPETPTHANDETATFALTIYIVESLCVASECRKEKVQTMQIAECLSLNHC